MQLLSLGWLLGAAAVQPVMPDWRGLLQTPEMQRNGAVLIGLLVLDQVIRILATWGASKIAARDTTSTLRNAFYLWGALLAFIFIVAIAFGLLLPIVVSLPDRWRVLSALGGMVFLTLVVGFTIPMKIYAIGFWRAFFLLLLAGLFELIVFSGVSLAARSFFLNPQDLAKIEGASQANAAEWRMKIDELTGKDPVAEIDRLLDEATRLPRKPLREREAAVRELQPRLEKRRRTLPPGDPAAAKNFRAQLDRYLRLLNEVKAERASRTANEARYFPAENLTSFVT